MLVLDNSFMNPHIRLLVVRSVDWLFCLSYIISLHIHAPIRVLVLNRFLQTMSHFHFFANMDEKKNPNVPINICIFWIFTSAKLRNTQNFLNSKSRSYKSIWLLHVTIDYRYKLFDFLRCVLSLKMTSSFFLNYTPTPCVHSVTSAALLLIAISLWFVYVILYIS